MKSVVSERDARLVQAISEADLITERCAPAEGYSTHEALKAKFRHYADLGRKPRDGVERGVDRTQWAKLVSESPDLPARLATADADLVFAKVAASAEINQCVRPAWRYYLLTIHNIKVQTVRARRHRRLGFLSQFRHVRRRERGRDEDPIGGEDV